MNDRTTIFRNSSGELMMVREHLSTHPSGNSAQRKKALKSGWRPEWIPAGRPAPLYLGVVGSNIFPTPQFPNGVSPVPGAVVEAWHPPIGPAGYVEGAYTYWQATGKLLPDLSLDSFLEFEPFKVPVRVEVCQ